MGKSKRYLVMKAFKAMGLASEDSDVSADQLQDALTSLNDMLAEWTTVGIRLGDNRDGDLNADSGIPDWANRAVWSNLAVELAAGIGRDLEPRVVGMAERGYNHLLAKEAVPIPYRIPDTLPAGAGNKPWRENGREFLVDDNEDNIDADTDSELEFK